MKNKKTNIYDILNITYQSSEQRVQYKYDAFLESLYTSDSDRIKAEREMDLFKKLGKERYDNQMESSYGREFDDQIDIAINMINSRGTYQRPMNERYVDSGNKKSFRLTKKRILAGALAAISLISVIAGNAIKNASGNDSNNTSIVQEEDTTENVNEIDLVPDELYKIDYIIESGDFNKSIIAEKLGLSSEQIRCAEINNPKIGDVVKMDLVGEGAETAGLNYDYEHKVVSNFVCYYQTPEHFRSLIEVARYVAQEQPGLLEGEEYHSNGKNPYNEVANKMIKDNPNLASEYSKCQSGNYRICFHGTQKEFEQLVEQGLLNIDQTKDYAY